MKTFLNLLILCLFYDIVCFAEEESNFEPVRILVTGSLSPEGMERIGKPISVVNEDEIQKTQGSSIGEALSSQPGISSTSFGPGASRPIIRGQGKERVRVIENGLENGDVSAASDDHAVTNDPLTTERIDILRGASTLMFGSQAIGGVVNIIDDSISEENIGKPLSGKVNISAGDSASDELSGAAILKGQADTINWYLSGFNRSTDDIKVPGLKSSRLENSDTNSSAVKVGVSQVSDEGFIGVALRHNEADYGIPVSEEGDVRIDLKQSRIESRGAVHLHKDFFDSVRFGMSFSNYKHKELEGKETGTIYERKAFESRVLLTHYHHDSLEGGLGLQLNYDELATTGEEAFIPSNQNFKPAIFLIEDFALSNNLIWQLGGRYEYSDVAPDDLSDKNFNLYSTSTGLVWHDDQKNYSAGLNLSYSERGANATELFAYGAHLASQTFEIGNSDLNKESSLGAELTLRKLTGSSRGSLTAFIQDYSDYINLSPSGFEEENLPVFSYENINARFWGFEAEAEQNLLSTGKHLLFLSAGFDMVRAENTDNNENLPRITPVRTRLELNYSYDIFSGFIETIFVEKQNKIAEFESQTGGYTMLNAGMNINLSDSLDLFIKGTNLSNEEARVHTSFLKDQVPLRGRAFFAGLRANF